MTVRRHAALRSSTLVSPTISSISTIQILRPAKPAKPVAIAWAPSGNYLAVSLSGGVIILYFILESSNSPIRSNPIRTFRSHTADVLQLSFSRTNFLLSGSIDRTLRLYHPDTSVCLRKFVHPDMVTTVQFHPHDHDFVLSGCCDGITRIWRLTDHALLSQTPMNSVVTSAAFTPDGHSVLVSGYDGKVQLLKMSDLMPHRLQRIALPPLSPRSGFARSKKEKPPPPPILKPTTIADTNVRRVKRNRPGVKIQGMCVVPDSSRIVSSSIDGQLCEFDSDAEIKARYRANVKSDTLLLSSSISSDRRYLMYDAVKGTVRLIDLQPTHVTNVEGKKKEKSLKLETLPIMVDSEVSCAAFAPHSVIDKIKLNEHEERKILMAVGGEDGSLRIVEAYYSSQ